MNVSSNADGADGANGDRADGVDINSDGGNGVGGATSGSGVDGNVGVDGSIGADGNVGVDGNGADGTDGDSPVNGGGESSVGTTGSDGSIGGASGDGTGGGVSDGADATQTTKADTSGSDAQAGETTTQPVSQAAATATETTTAAPTEEAKPKTSIDPSVLKGKIICIDPGHQRKANNDLEQVAPDSSTKKPKVSSGTAGISTGDMEYVLNLAVALKLKALFEAQGAKVVMTRTEHDVNVSNIERAKIGNNAKADLAIRIHADGSNNRDVKGVSMLIPSSKYIGEGLAATSKKAGQAVLNEVISATGAKNRGLSVRDDMTGFNWSTVPVILIEMGFMSNAEEDKLLATDEYRAKMATGLYNGSIVFFGG